LDYQIFFDKGQVETASDEAYTSHNTKQLSIDEVVTLIDGLPEFNLYRKTHLK
jgi:hypothetical protein